jgi:hypothetical protein
MSHTLTLASLVSTTYLCLGMAALTVIKCGPTAFLKAGVARFHALQAEQGRARRDPPRSLLLIGCTMWTVGLVMWLPLVAGGFTYGLWLGLRQLIGRARQ